MKWIARILIILGAAWLIVMGVNWLREQRVLPVGQAVEQREGWSEQERAFGFGRGAQRESGFARGGDHHIEGPSLTAGVEMLGTLLKIAIITVIVVLIDKIVRFAARRRPRPSASA